MLKYKSISGTSDLLPPYTQMWQYLENKARELFNCYGYKEIRTPVLENTELFARSVGLNTDIVEKEMYTFCDKDKSSVSLRPEETAGVIRAYLENSLYAKLPLWKLFYIGPMFRRERPQAGRLRQFHQIGAEVVGSHSPGLDAEVIIWLKKYFDILGLKNIEIILNSSGCPKCRPGFSMRLKEELADKIEGMCVDCQRRYKRNIFRILDCKQESCRSVIDKLPKVIDSLCDGCNDHFIKLRKHLSVSKIDYKIAPHLVRGLDYYTKTVFEIISNCDALGSQNTLAAGGRYDQLVQDMGGQPTGAVGFSIGIERTAMVFEQLKNVDEFDSKFQVYLVSLDEESYYSNFELLNVLRNEGIQADIDYQGKSLKAQMRLANKLRSRYVIIRGENERKENIVVLKDMEKGQEEKVDCGKLIEVLKKKCN